VTPYQLTDALSVAFFGLLGLWAAVVRRHWFLRFAVVGGFLLLGLLIPAHEVVIEFGIQIAVITLGVWLARLNREWRPRISVESALLAMVVVALSAAVIARAPEDGPISWLWMFRVGVGTGLLALVCLWAVCGKARWLWRVIGGLAGIIAFVALHQFGDAVQNALNQRQNGYALRDSIVAYYTQGPAVAWLIWNLPSTGIGIAIFFTMLLLGRASGWFDSRIELREKRSTWVAWGARVGLCAIFLAVATPLLYLLYRLQSPTEFPAATAPSPNGHFDLLAAGVMVPATTGALVQATAPTAAQIEAEMKTIERALERIDEGLRKENYVDLEMRETRGTSGIDDYALIHSAEEALMLRSIHVANTGSIDEQIDVLLDLATFSQEAYRGGGLDGYVYSDNARLWGINGLLSLLPQLDAGQCRRTARQLIKLNREREPLEQAVQIQRAIDDRQGWVSHLNMILAEWSAHGPYKWQCDYIRRNGVQLPGLATRLAIRAYCLERGRPPDRLADLAPEYLPELPLDVYGEGPLRYRSDRDAVILYSVGPNGADDGGTAYPIDASGGIDDSRGDRVWTMSPADLGLE
jgi:hypothetical protein